jgi:hypothetical protein
MSAAAYATGSVDNCSAAGKLGGKKCSAGKGGKTLGHLIVGIIIIVVVIVMIVVISRFFGKKKEPLKASPPMKETPSIGNGGAVQRIPIELDVVQAPKVPELEVPKVQVPKVEPPKVPELQVPKVVPT